MKQNTSKELTKTTEELIRFLGITVPEVTTNEKEQNTYAVQIDSTDAPLLIGKHGETLMALQHITKAIVKKQLPQDEDFVLIMDVGSYRKQHEDKIIQMADTKARKVLAEDVKETLFPMNSYHRRIVHTYIATNFPDIETGSIGEEPNRRITLKKRA